MLTVVRLCSLIIMSSGLESCLPENEREILFTNLQGFFEHHGQVRGVLLEYCNESYQLLQYVKLEPQVNQKVFKSVRTISSSAGGQACSDICLSLCLFESSFGTLDAGLVKMIRTYLFSVEPTISGILLIGQVFQTSGWRKKSQQKLRARPFK